MRQYPVKQPVERRGKPISGYTRHEGSRWIEVHRQELPNDRWIAADHLGFVAQDTSFDGLLAEVKAQGKEPSSVAVAFITDKSA